MKNAGPLINFRPGMSRHFISLSHFLQDHHHHHRQQYCPMKRQSMSVRGPKPCCFSRYVSRFLNIIYINIYICIYIICIYVCVCVFNVFVGDSGSFQLTPRPTDLPFALQGWSLSDLPCSSFVETRVGANHSITTVQKKHKSTISH